MPFSVFGYGSLVNRGTLPAVLKAEPLTVRGWRRAWRCCSITPNGGRCALSVVEDPAAEIDGLTLTFDDALWPAMAAREKNYDPIILRDYGDVILFRAKPHADRWADAGHPVCLSYIDTTIQGFLRTFGAEGADRFMATTSGWERPILDDRTAPTYPRAQPLTGQETAAVDRLLSHVDAVPRVHHDNGPPRQIA